MAHPPATPPFLLQPAEAGRRPAAQAPAARAKGLREAASISPLGCLLGARASGLGCAPDAPARLLASGRRPLRLLRGAPLSGGAASCGG